MNDGDRSRQEANRIRLSIVEGRLTAFQKWSEFTQLVIESPDRPSLVTALQQAPFGFSEMVASHLVDLPLGRATALGRHELEQEAAELRRSIE